MKNYSFSAIALTLAITVFSSCATMRVNYSGKKVQKVQSIALVSTMLGKLQQPLFPLIDAAIFNDKTDKIATQIMELQQQHINRCRETIASKLQETFSCTVLYSDSLHAIEGFSALKESYNFESALRIQSPYYPFIVTPSDDLIPFKFQNDNVLNFFANKANYKSTIAAIAQQTKTDLIAVSYSTLTVVGFGMFGIVGNLNLTTHLYLFDKEGDLITDAHTWSPTMAISGKEIRDYATQLNSLPIILKPMLDKVKLNF